MEQRDHRHEHVVHGHVCGGGDERAGFRHVFQAPGLHFAVIAQHHVAAGQQAMRGFGVLRFDFRGVGFARTGREIVGRVYKMMLPREFCDLCVAQRLHRGTRRRFSFGCHGSHCATGRRYVRHRCFPRYLAFYCLMPSFSASFGRQMMQKRRAIRQKRECAEDAEGTESMFAIAAAAIADKTKPAPAQGEYR